MFFPFELPVSQAIMNCSSPSETSPRFVQVVRENGRNQRIAKQPGCKFGEDERLNGTHQRRIKWIELFWYHTCTFWSCSKV